MYELRERIYHYDRRKLMVHHGPLYPFNDALRQFPMTHVVKHWAAQAWKIETYDPVTGLLLAESLSKVNDSFKNPSLAKKAEYRQWLVRD